MEGEVSLELRDQEDFRVSFVLPFFLQNVYPASFRVSPHIYNLHQSDANNSCDQVTPVYRERRGPEGFLDFLDFPGPLEVVDPRETEAVMVTPAVPALAWRVHGDPRVLMGLRDIRVLGNLVLRVSEARLENKVSAIFHIFGFTLPASNESKCMNQIMTPVVILRVVGVSGLPGPQGWPGRPGSCDIGQCRDLVRNAEKPHSKTRDIKRKQRREERRRKKKEKREMRRKRNKENL